MPEAFGRRGRKIIGTDLSAFASFGILCLLFLSLLVLFVAVEGYLLLPAGVTM